VKKYCLLIFLSLSIVAPVFAQDKKSAEEEAAYTKTITQRADKIVAALGISDHSKAAEVSTIISKQYRNLSNIHAARDAKIKEAKLQNTDNKELQAAAIKAIEDKAKSALDKLHKKYISSLSAKLTSEQVEKVKDGMTYGVVPITYKGYNEMLPNLTEVQKKQILDWLIEARENAMDAETSDKKHWWFGKYKGRINNYLSAQGIDMNKASKEWQERIKAEQAAKKN
jgi:hypothetical protein